MLEAISAVADDVDFEEIRALRRFTKKNRVSKEEMSEAMDAVAAVVNSEKISVLTKKNEISKEEMSEAMNVVAGVDFKKMKPFLFPCLPEEPWARRLLGLGRADDDDYCEHELGVSKINREICVKLDSEAWKDEMDPEFCDLENKNFDILQLLFASPEYDYLITVDGHSEVRAKELEQKCIMVCCFWVPQESFSFAWLLRVASFDLYSKIDNFELVIVPMMIPGWEDNQAALDHFFSAFPCYCLTVPLKDCLRREKICSTVGLQDSGLLLVDSGKVLLHSDFCSLKEHQLVPRVAGDDRIFPFANSVHLNNMSSLKDFLDSDFVLTPQLTPTSARFGSKPVWLYLYRSGQFLGSLWKIAEECRRMNKFFEIVIMFIPSFPLEIDPRDFPALLTMALDEKDKKKNVLWWVAPYRFSASARLHHLFHREEDDKVVVLGPNAKYVDFHGAAIMKNFGIDAYPFTVQRVVENCLADLRRVTIDLFFESSLGISCDKFKGKNVLLVFDSSYIDRGLEQLSDVCENMMTMLKEDDPDLAAFRFCFHKQDYERRGEKRKVNASGAKLFTDPSWLGAESAVEKFFFRFLHRRFRTILAFAKNGRICSILAHRRVSLCGDKAQASPFNDDLLEREVSIVLEAFLDCYESDHWRMSIKA